MKGNVILWKTDTELWTLESSQQGWWSVYLWKHSFQSLPDLSIHIQTPDFLFGPLVGHVACTMATHPVHTPYLSYISLPKQIKVRCNLLKTDKKLNYPPPPPLIPILNLSSNDLHNPPGPMGFTTNTFFLLICAFFLTDLNTSRVHRKVLHCWSSSSLHAINGNPGLLEFRFFKALCLCILLYHWI